MDETIRNRERPISQIQARAEEDSRRETLQRSREQAAATTYLRDLGELASEGVPVRVVTREVSRRDPNLDRHRLLIALMTLADRGSLVHDAGSDSVRLA